MNALTENPEHLCLFDKEAEPFRGLGLQAPLRISQGASSGFTTDSPFCLFLWRRGEMKKPIFCWASNFVVSNLEIIGEHPTPFFIWSIDELDNHGWWDLGIM